MEIRKVINNNVISAFDESGQEVVVMGTGIGFKAHPGDPVNEEKIQKIFRIENRKIAAQFKELLENMPLEHMQISTDIISYAKKTMNLKLSQSIYVTLTDHINFAIERMKQGIKLQNALLWEIKKFYPHEYSLGKFAVDLVNERLGLKFTADEAGFIALHIVNAEYDTSINDTFAMTKMIQGILDIVKEELDIKFDEESLHYERFITHLKFLAQRIYRHELLSDQESELLDMICKKYPSELACSKKIAEYIRENFGEEISGEEMMFLAIHIKRVSMQPDMDE